MFMKYLSGSEPTAGITLQELKEVSDIVNGANQITDEYFVQVYEKLISAYEAKAKVETSDRRKCKLLELVEANALLYGRYEVAYDDLMAVKWGLCQGGNEAQHKIFEEVAKPIIAEAAVKKPQAIDEVQLKLLTELEAKIPPVPKGCPNERLVEIARQVEALLEDVNAVRPQLPSTVERQKKILAALDKSKTTVMTRITKGEAKAVST
jgi:hypothetical protein